MVQHQEQEPDLPNWWGFWVYNYKTDGCTLVKCTRIYYIYMQIASICALNLGVGVVPCTRNGRPSFDLIRIYFGGAKLEGVRIHVLYLHINMCLSVCQSYSISISGAESICWHPFEIVFNSIAFN